MFLYFHFVTSNKTMEMQTMTNVRQSAHKIFIYGPILKL